MTALSQPAATLPRDTPPASTPSGFRWVICGLLFWVTTANYIDRGVFGNLAPELAKQIPGWSQDAYWYMQVAFNSAYAISLLLAGRLMDVIGLRWGFVLMCAFWGLASMSHALVGTVAGFFLVRILLGLGEGGNFPAAIKTTAEWFPKRERALATGLFNCGTNIGGVLVPFCLPSAGSRWAGAERFWSPPSSTSPGSSPGCSFTGGRRSTRESRRPSWR
jgi:ACS family hexuronate transporter-like MFS transporter